MGEHGPSARSSSGRRSSGSSLGRRRSRAQPRARHFDATDGPTSGQNQQPACNQRWCSDVFLVPCWRGAVISVAFAIDCHDREVSAFVASPRPLTGADIRTLVGK